MTLPIRPAYLYLLVFVSLFSCDEENPTIPTFCRLTTVTEHRVDANGQPTDAQGRLFTYANGRLTTLREQTLTGTSDFRAEYAGAQLTNVTNGSVVLTMTYSGTGSLPTGATFSRNGVAQSSFIITYTPQGQLTQLIETRAVLPDNSLTKQRTYTLSYDNAGQLTTERARFALIDGTFAEQEVTYEVDNGRSAYAMLPDRALVTILALAQNSENQPSRFWHRSAVTSYKRYDVTAGNRTLRESATLTPTYDATNRLSTQEQTSLLYTASPTNPITRKTRQTFAYGCE